MFSRTKKGFRICTEGGYLIKKRKDLIFHWKRVRVKHRRRMRELEKPKPYTVTSEWGHFGSFE